MVLIFVTCEVSKLLTFSDGSALHLLNMPYIFVTLEVSKLLKFSDVRALQ